MKQWNSQQDVETTCKLVWLSSTYAWRAMLGEVEVLLYGGEQPLVGCVVKRTAVDACCCGELVVFLQPRVLVLWVLA